MDGSRLTKEQVCSPVKHQNYVNLQEEKKYILKKMHHLFVVYASKASKYAYKQLTQTYFMELIEDTYASSGRHLYKNTTEWKNIVTLYHCKGKKNGMIYSQFLKVLPSIATYFSGSRDSQNDLKYLLKHLLLVYSNKVSKQIEQTYVQFNPSIKKDTQQYIAKLANNLYIIYKIYFPQQINHQFANPLKPQFQAFDSVITFFKEFEMYPKIISASHLYLIFTEVMQNEQSNMFTWADYDQKRKLGDKGVVFKFCKFIDLLVQVSRVSAHKIRQIQNPEWQVERQKSSLKAMLQYMQSIKMKENKDKKFKQVRFSFLLVQQYISEAQKWMNTTQEHTIKQGIKSNSFFDMFQKMKL